MTKTTQLRAICPACFNQQALRNGSLMVQHGYTRPDGYYANIGTCHGTGKAHFGTAAGREEASRIAAGLVRHAEECEQLASRVAASEPGVTVYGRKREFGGKYTTVVIEQPTQAQRDAYVAYLNNEAHACRTAAKEYETRVANWSPMEPVVVPVEKREQPVHWRGYWFSKSGHKACAASAMGAMRGYSLLTEKTAEVTCERCKQRKSFIEAVEAGK